MGIGSSWTILLSKIFSESQPELQKAQNAPSQNYILLIIESTVW